MTPIDAVGDEVAVLWVAVHRDAGGLGDLAADGASGLCTAQASWIRCPAANGPVTFRWGPVGGDWVLTVQQDDGTWVEGSVTVAPGVGVAAAVLPAAQSRSAMSDRLRSDTVTPDVIRDGYVRTGDNPVSAPSAPEIGGLAALVDHPNPKVRRELPDALLPWLRHTSGDPTPPGSPPLVPVGTLFTLAHDKDPAVRRRLAARLRDVRDGEIRDAEVNEALEWLVTTGGGAQRASLVAMASKSKEGTAPALDAWRIARVRMRDPGAPGRAAIKTLAALSTELDPGGEVDPAVAVRDCFELHPERTWSLWNAWRRDVPLDRALVVGLFRDTVGWSPALLTFWAKTAPDELEAAFVAWESSPPHTTRYVDLLTRLSSSPDPRWARLRGDNLSAPAEGPGPR